MLDKFAQLSETHCAKEVDPASVESATALRPIIEGASIVVVGGSSVIRGQRGSVRQLIDDQALITFDDTAIDTQLVPTSYLRFPVVPQEQHLNEV